MQKVVTIRASQKDLEAALEKFISYGWRILNVTRGSMWGRVGLSYKWTIILELGENYNNAEQKILYENFLQKAIQKPPYFVSQLLLVFLHCLQYSMQYCYNVHL